MYKLLTAVEILNPIGALRSNLISFRAFRTYFAVFEVQARREAASRVRRRAALKQRGHNIYRTSEVAQITETTVRNVEQDLKALKSAGLLSFDEDRIWIQNEWHSNSKDLFADFIDASGLNGKIPIPRNGLKFVARCETQSIAKSLLGYFLRGLRLRNKTEVRSCGTAKVSWLCRTLGISERSARYARKKLIDLEWISKDSTRLQRKLNRDGAYFEVNSQWKRKVRCEAKNSKRSCVSSTASQFAPPPSKNPVKFAPPKEKQKTPYGSRNQKTHLGDFTGVKKQKLPLVTLKNIIREDLEVSFRTLALYDEACATGLIGRSENEKLNFFAAAVRARELPAEQARKVFIGIIKKKLWHHITLSQEDKAREEVRTSFETIPSRIKVTTAGSGACCLAGDVAAELLNSVRRVS